MTTIKFVLDDGYETELTETQTVHYLLQENRKLRDHLEGTQDYIDGAFESFAEQIGYLQDEIKRLQAYNDETDYYNTELAAHKARAARPDEAVIADKKPGYRGGDDVITFSAVGNVAAQPVPFTIGGEDIVTFDTLDYSKVNDSWLD